MTPRKRHPHRRKSIISKRIIVLNLSVMLALLAVVVFASTLRFIVVAALIIAVLLAYMLVSTIITKRRIIKPLLDLTKDVADVDYDNVEGIILTGITRTDEIGDLARTIRSMLVEISKQQAKERDAHELAQLVMDAAPFAVGVADENAKVLMVGKYVTELFGVDDPMVFAERLYDFSPPLQPCGTPTPVLAAKHFMQAMENGSARFDWMHKAADGSPMPVEVQYVSFMYRERRMLASFTQDMRYVRAVQEREHIALRELDLRKRLLHAENRAAEALLSNDADSANALNEAMEIIGTTLNLDRVQIWSQAELDGEKCFVLQLNWESELGKAGGNYKLGTVAYYSSSPQWFDELMRGKPINGPTSDFPPEIASHHEARGTASIAILPMLSDGGLGCSFTVHDCKNARTFTKDEMDVLTSIGLMLVSVIIQNTQRELANIDPLTGVRNRRYLMYHAKQELQACIDAQQDFSLIMLDVDSFKTINDQYGHLVGDEVLKILTARLQHALKDGTLIARYGGEEFIITLPGMSSAVAAKTAWRIKKSVEASDFHVDDLMLKVTSSFGIASYSTQAVTLEDIIGNADTACYQAKKDGRDTVVVYAEDALTDE